MQTKEKNENEWCFCDHMTVAFFLMCISIALLDDTFSLVVAIVVAMSHGVVNHEISRFARRKGLGGWDSKRNTGFECT